MSVKGRQVKYSTLGGPSIDFWRWPSGFDLRTNMVLRGEAGFPGRVTSLRLRFPAGLEWLVALNAGQIPQRANARQEEIGATLDRDEALQLMDTGAQRIGLHRKYLVTLN